MISFILNCALIQNYITNYQKNFANFDELEDNTPSRSINSSWSKSTPSDYNNLNDQRGIYNKISEEMHYFSISYRKSCLYIKHQW